MLTQPEKTDGAFAARPAVDAGTTQRRLQQQSLGEAHAPQAVAAAAPLASTSRRATWPHQRARRRAEPSQGRGPPDLSQGTRIRCNVDGIRCVMVAADRPWPHQNAKPTGQEALDAAARYVVAWSRPGAPCCRTRRSGHGAAGSGRGSSPCDHAASAVTSPTPRRGEEGCGGKEGEHGKGLAAAVLVAARTPGSTLERRRGLRSGWRRGWGIASLYRLLPCLRRCSCSTVQSID